MFLLYFYCVVHSALFIAGQYIKKIQNIVVQIWSNPVRK